MRSMRCNLPSPLSMSVQGEFLGVTDPVSGKIIAIESYEGLSPTFTWMSDKGHVFCFLPPHAFSFGASLKECVDLRCPAGPISVSCLAIDEGGHGCVGEKNVSWKRYVASVDWYESNELLHLVIGYDGRLMFIRNARFQVGGDKYSPPAWKKSRATWVI